MTIYTSAGLVAHCKMALNLNTKYMWGGIMRLITKEYISLLRKMYGTKSGTGYSEARYKTLESMIGKNCYGCDCIGLIKSYLWSGKPTGGVGSPCYPTATNGSAPDINATAMFNMSKNKGTIDKLPEIPGLILYSKTHPHVGVYIGNGWTIECTLGSRGDGVVKRKLDKFWEYWFECPFITYTKPAKPGKLTVGSKVKIKTTATTYAGSGSIKIPAWVKGNIYTISQLNGTMSLLKEINSWVKNDDLEIQ